MTFGNHRIRRRQGLTLIEVMVSLVILGTLLASLVVARARSLHQWSLAGRKQDAIAAADALLSAWWETPQGIPRNKTGELPKLKMQWQTREIKNSAAEDMDVEIVRLTVSDQNVSTNESISGIAEPPPLAYVDVVVSKYQSKPAQADLDNGQTSSVEHP